jgi:glutamyl-tRNA reductase
MGKGMLRDMGNRQHTGDPHYSVEGIRANEVGRLFNKISLSPEQWEAIEDLSHSLVYKLVHGPIAETIALVQKPSESAAIGETSHGRRGTSSPGAAASALR